jgi:hypothetical protein
MKKILLLLLLLILASCSVNNSNTTVTYIESNGNKIAVEIISPDVPRYDDGAPIIIYTPTFFTPDKIQLGNLMTSVTDDGFIHVSFLWPGIKNGKYESTGEYDYGGENSIKAFSDVIRFAAGEIPDVDGNYIQNLASVTPLTDNVGLYAFSHPGIAATNVLALYPGLNIKYLVGRENPTTDILYPLELGYFEEGKPVVNPLYDYPDDYSSKEINLDYSTIDWSDELGVPYFDADANGVYDPGEFKLGNKIPTMFGKYFYSIQLTKALKDSLESRGRDWPEGIATYEETSLLWPFRTTVNNYNKINKDVKILLLFSVNDHVQSVLDKPHIHQAYDGFTANGNWVRLNPDSAYLKSSPDNDANAGPSDWMDVKDWSVPNKDAYVSSFASICEMADRTYFNNWEDNLDSTLT